MLNYNIFINFFLNPVCISLQIFINRNGFFKVRCEDIYYGHRCVTYCCLKIFSFDGKK